MDQQQSVTLDQAIENLEKILAHILVEEDYKIKGIQIGQGWGQLKAIKSVIPQLSFFDRRKYNKIVQQQEQKLSLYENNYISELELELAIEDVRRINEMIVNYKGNYNKKEKKDLKEKIIFMRNELEKLKKKNQSKGNDPKWEKVLKDADTLINKIDTYKDQDNDEQAMRQSAQEIGDLLKTIRYEKKIENEEEEELLLIVEKLTELRNMQQQVNYIVEEEGIQLNQVDQQVDDTCQNTDKAFQDYAQANQFVKQRRRTKIKLFFTGLFAAIGSIGGKIGAIFAGTFGASVGNKVANTVQRKDTI